MKKKVDPRIRQSLQDAVRNNHRSLIVLVGDKGRDQVVNLHYMLSKMTLQARPSVLWCYKHELGFSSNKKKRMKVIKKRVKQGLVDPNKDDPFELFISSTTIRFAYYTESHKVIGNTYGMCVLQDFEALTPNLLARTIETVQGGGLAVILINNMSSLKQLYSLTMDVHARLRTEAHSKVVGRFNERFILSLADCPAAIVADDELNVLPISSHVRAMSGAVTSAATRPVTTESAPDLKQLKESLADTPPIGPLIAKAKTVDQAKALLRFEEAISEKTLRSTVALTAPRGRGKSAALGLAVVAAVAHDYANIFVTSPSPENLRTFFAFLFVGFDAMGYQEHTDYEIIQSTDPALNRAVVRVNVFRNHRQTVQYVDPVDAPHSLSQAELLVIDEAAAIPLPVIEAMLGPYLVFMCSTITGYEGTGRSLSLKLMRKLREGSAHAPARNTAVNGNSNRRADRDVALVASRSGSGRVFREVHMETPIRYGDKDPIEAWLYDLLCLEAGSVRQVLTGGAPHPEECELYYVERDALFSRHRASEAFLHRVMALFVASHYKNSPNDLQMLSDAPAHGLLVLLAPTRTDTEKLPDVLCAIQVCLEGRISSRSSKAQLSRGHRASGDLIPWTISQQFQEPDFATLSGARIVRVATHPDVQRLGYGTRAMRLLLDYYSGRHNISLDDQTKGNPRQNDSGLIEDGDDDAGKKTEGKTLLNEIIGPRKNIPPLLRRLHERPAESLDYVGVSFGLTQGLYGFWNRLGFLPLYVRLTTNDLTGEHTSIMLTTTVSSTQQDNAADWLPVFNHDFRRRFVHLLGYEFRSLPPGLVLAILNSDPEFRESKARKMVRGSIDEIKAIFTPYDRRRLESYSRNLVDYHVIMDMLPKLAELYILGGFGSQHDLRLSPAQSAILVALGLQRCSVEDLEKRLGIQVSQVLALFNKVIRKICAFLRDLEETDVAARIGPAHANGTADAILPRVSLNSNSDEMWNAESSGNKADIDRCEDRLKSDSEHGEEIPKRESEQEAETEQTSGMSKFRVTGTENEWEEALPKDCSRSGVPGTVSIKSVRKKSKRKNMDGVGAGKERDVSWKKKKLTQA